MATLLSLDICERFMAEACTAAELIAQSDAAQARVVRMAREIVGDNLMDDEHSINMAGELVVSSLAAWKRHADG